MKSLRQLTRPQWIGLGLVVLTLFIDMLLYSLLVPLVPYLTDKLHLSSTTIGVLLSIYAMGSLASTPFVGKLSDRFGRKIPILIGLGGMALSTLLFAWADTTWMLMTARFVQGISAATTWAASFALLADLFPAKVRSVTIGFALIGIEVGSLIGAPLAGLLFEVGGYRMPFVFSAILTMVNILLVFIFLKEPAHQKGEDASMVHLLRNRSMLFMMGIVLLANSTLYFLEPTLPNYLADDLGINSTMIGLLFGIMTFSYAVLAPYLGALSDRYHPMKIILIGIFCLALTLPSLIIARSLWQEIIAMLLVGMSISVASSPALSSVGKMVDEDGKSSYGAAYGLFNMFHALSMIIGPLIGGSLTEIFSVPRTIMIASGSIFVFALLMSAFFTRLNRN